jgi:hypothetical protein
MTKNTSEQNDVQHDFIWDFDDDADLSGSQLLGGEVVPQEGAGKNEDPNALPITLKATTINGEDCVELYAHGDTLSYETEKMSQRAVLLARVTSRDITMFPLGANAHRAGFLEPKYDELRSITIVAEEHNPWWLPETIQDFDEMLTELPTGFARHAIYGLGFKWEYRLIPEAILEMVGVTELVIEPGDGASVELPTFRLGIDRFTQIRRAIDTISNKASSRSLKARRLAAYNETLHAARPDEFERRYPEVKAGEIYDLVQLRGRASNRSAKDGLAAAQVVREDAQRIAGEEPEKLFELKAVIEQVTLAQLIGEFESMLQKNLAEPKWQTFFKANPFVLGLAFPYPVILFQDQASVGGTTIRGNGESIVDFLMAQRFTGNLALIEIKRPSTALVEPKAYRGDLYAPHRDLTASMAQVLDQRAQLLHHFAIKKSQDKALDDAHVSSVNCIVVVGSMPTDAAKIRSLDLFRHSSKDVSVITFDELLEKLKELHRLISAGVPAPTQAAAILPASNESDDNPF